MSREQELLKDFNDPDGVIDDSEELIEEIPGWLEEIVSLRAKLERVREVHRTGGDLYSLVSSWEDDALEGKS